MKSVTGSLVEGLQFTRAHSSALVPLTEENEQHLRDYVLAFWRARHARRARQGRLEKTETPALPVDLSRACKLMAQLTMTVFPIAGRVVANKRHSFIWFPDTSVYDINRVCDDVQMMLRRGREPYEIDLKQFASKQQRDSHATWHARVLELSKGFLSLPHVERFSPGRAIEWHYTCPYWARPMMTRVNEDENGTGLPRISVRSGVCHT